MYLVMNQSIEEIINLGTWWRYRGKVRVIKIPPERNMNVCNEFYGNPSIRC